MRKLLVLMCILLLSGCANNFKRFYISANNPSPKEPCQEIDIQQADLSQPNVLERMFQRGYYLVGYSSYNGPAGSLDQIRTVAKEVQACAVLFSAHYTHTERGVAMVPQYMPGSTYTAGGYGVYSGPGVRGAYVAAAQAQTPGYFYSQPVPWSVRMGDHVAVFFAKMPQAILGIWPARPTDQMKKDGVTGALVRAVRDGSPADKGGIVPGDVVVSIDGVPIAGDDKATEQAIRERSGRTVDLLVYRDGKTITKPVTLN